MISRRRFARLCAAAPLVAFVGERAHGQVSSGSLRLFREFGDSLLFAISPDGASVCLFSLSTAFGRFPYQEQSWHNLPPDKSRRFLQAVDVGTGRPMLSCQFQSDPSSASFFSDGNKIYVETQVVKTGKGLAHLEIVVDLHGGQRDEHTLPISLPMLREGYALSPGKLLRAEYGKSAAGHIDDLVTLELPSYKEVARAPFATREREAGSTIGGFGIDSPLFFASDRSTVAYSFDRTLVYRRTADLEVIWTKRIEQEYTQAGRLAVSADRKSVAAAVSDNAFSYQEKRFYVGVYSADGGREVARLPVSGTEGLALSPDGRFLVVGDRKSPVDPTFHIYEVSTGKLMSSTVHAHPPNDRELFLTGGFTTHGFEFTSDGKYLITSGASVTKVWSLAPQ